MIERPVVIGAGDDIFSDGNTSTRPVITTARAIPSAPSRFPLRAVSWCDSPRKLRMNSRLLTM